MNLQPRVLVVSLPGGLVGTLGGQLSSAGYEPLFASDFRSAKTILDQRPDVLVTDVKLGAYNGLHLAIRAGSAGIPVIVVGDPDPVLKAEAERQQAVYLTPPLGLDRVIDLIGELVSASRHPRRSTRKPVPHLDVIAHGVHGRLVDVSYDGLRFEALGVHPSTLPNDFVVQLPQFEFACRVQRVWTGPVPGVEDGSMWCGATVDVGDAEAASAWRSLVDGLPSLAVSS